jgi:hypothetical protein
LNRALTLDERAFISARRVMALEMIQDCVHGLHGKTDELQRYLRSESD